MAIDLRSLWEFLRSDAWSLKTPQPRGSLLWGLFKSHTILKHLYRHSHVHIHGWFATSQINWLWNALRNWRIELDSSQWPQERESSTRSYFRITVFVMPFICCNPFAQIISVSLRVTQLVYPGIPKDWSLADSKNFNHSVPAKKFSSTVLYHSLICWLHASAPDITFVTVQLHKLVWVTIPLVND